MQIIKTAPGSQITIGRQGEQNARQVRFDLNVWLADFDQTGVVELIFQRPGDSAPFPVETLREGEELVWTITEMDTANAGTNGKAELRYYLNGALLKSAISPVTVDKTLGASGQVPEAPGQDWLDQALEAGAQAKAAAAKAEEATKHAPRIGANGNWYVWDADNERFEDTGCFSGGEAPYIGANGHWFIGAEDTGVSASGPKGDKGDKGDKGEKGDTGAQGPKGDKGEPGATGPQGPKGDTGATGPQGPKGENGETGSQGPKGDTGAQGPAGPAGPAGKTPEKGVDYWTQADQTTIVNDVLTALPTWTGGAY